MTLVKSEAPTADLAGLDIADLERAFAVAARQRELLADYIKKRLTPEKHFYTVRRDDGSEGKPSLTKDGAEVVCLPHALKPDYEWLGGPKEPPGDDTPYQITVKCVLMHNGQFGGAGVGSASSHITTKAGERKPRQRDIGLRHNSTVKMAEKSAYIAATLSATAASEFFTQDMEDVADGQPAEPSGVDVAYFCQEHQTLWFKRGKMRNYAHPIGETDQWCNMPREAQESPAGSPQGRTETPTAPPTREALGEAFSALGLTTWAEQLRWIQEHCPMVPEDRKTWKLEHYVRVGDALTKAIKGESESPQP